MTSIGDYVFYKCTSLTGITIPDSVTSIGDYVFYKCTSLTGITIPDSVIIIGDFAFCDCASLTGITIPDSVISIGIEAFTGTAYYNNTSNWENGVLYIGNYLIKSDASISGSYTVKAGTKTMADAAFASCSSLTDITIPDGVTNIGKSEFYYCTALTDIIIPDSVIIIGDFAFRNCISLTTISIPDSVTSIGDEAFYNTAYYNNTLNWENGVLYIGNYLISAEKSISGAYTAKPGAKIIADYAFYSCTSLTNITIPDR